MKMKKTILTIATILSIASIDANAKTYVGLDWHSTKAKFQDTSISGIAINTQDYYETHYRNIVPVIGQELSKNHAIEFSYLYSSQDKENNSTGLMWATGPMTGQPITTNIKTSLNVINIDLINKIRISNTRANILGILGLAAVDFSAKEEYNDGSSSKESKLGYGLNLGLGAEVDLDERFALNIKAKYTHVSGLDLSRVNGTDGLDSLFTLGAGVKFRF